MCKRAPGPRCLSTVKKQLATAKKQLANAEKRGDKDQIKQKKAKLKEREEAYALTTESIEAEKKAGHEDTAEKLEKKRAKLNKKARVEGAEAPAEDKSKAEPKKAKGEWYEGAKPLRSETPLTDGQAKKNAEVINAAAKANADKPMPQYDPKVEAVAKVNKGLTAEGQTPLNKQGQRSVEAYLSERSFSNSTSEEAGQVALDNAYESHIEEMAANGTTPEQIEALKARYPDKGAVLNGAFDDEISIAYMDNDLDVDESYDGSGEDEEW